MTRTTTVDLPTTIECAACCGTGEGMHPGATCRTCRGQGYAHVDLVAVTPWVGDCRGCCARTTLYASDDNIGGNYCAACLGIEDAMRDAGEMDDEEAA